MTDQSREQFDAQECTSKSVDDQKSPKVNDNRAQFEAHFQLSQRQAKRDNSGDESIPIKDVLADENHPAHAAVKTMLEKVDSGELSFCGCIGPMYSEPYCACEMKRRGLPLNEGARAADEKRFQESMQQLFGPGGEFHNPDVP